jgi:hypothetical protein
VRVGDVLRRFRERDNAAAVVGQVHAQPHVTLCHDGDEALLWDLAATPFITAGEGARHG